MFQHNPKANTVSHKNDQTTPITHVYVNLSYKPRLFAEPITASSRRSAAAKNLRNPRRVLRLWLISYTL